MLRERCLVKKKIGRQNEDIEGGELRVKNLPPY
jgi:hypothetical protein